MKTVNDLLNKYAAVAGANAVDHIRQLASPLAGLRVIHINSTREGGGVAEILHKLIPFKQALGIDARWLVIDGPPEYLPLHQGVPQRATGAACHAWQRRIERLRSRQCREFVRQHGDQLRGGRCRVRPRSAAGADLVAYRGSAEASGSGAAISTSASPFIRSGAICGRWVEGYDASIFSLAKYARRLASSAVHRRAEY